MSLANNQRDQLAKRLKADVALREPTWTADISLCAGGAVPAAGDAFLTIKAAGTVIAVAAVARRTFNSFNVVAELSQSAAEGLPEHFVYILVDNGASQAVTSKLAILAKQLGTSSVAFGYVATGNLDEAHMTSAAISFEYGNDARLGASGQ